MDNNIAVRLIIQAERIADMYSDELDIDKRNQLYNAIQVCRKFVEDCSTYWGILYDAVQGDEGIWEYADYPEFSEELQNMWILETDILSCICYNACTMQEPSTPQDLEIREENISKFAEFIENNFFGESDYQKCLDFWDENMCY